MFLKENLQTVLQGHVRSYTNLRFTNPYVITCGIHINSSERYTMFCVDMNIKKGTLSARGKHVVKPLQATVALCKVCILCSYCPIARLSLAFRVFILIISNVKCKLIDEIEEDKSTKVP